jgi:hypothetical protein
VLEQAVGLRLLLVDEPREPEAEERRDRVAQEQCATDDRAGDPGEPDREGVVLDERVSGLVGDDVRGEPAPPRS